jgi:hypothetical protein
MSALTIWSIEGHKRSACLHDSFSVVSRGELLDIIPADTLRSSNPAKTLRTVYGRALKEAGNDTERAVILARRALGLAP